MNDIAVVNNDIELNINTDLHDILDKISHTSLQRRKQKTPQRNIKVRQGKQGKMFKYASRNVYETWLDTHYPGWSYQVDSNSVKETAGFFYVTGTLVVYENGILKRTITEFGCDEVEFNKDNKPVIIQYLKNASTDALKRCVMRLGGMNDIHGDQEDVEIKIDDNEVLWFINEVIPVLLKKQVNGVNIFESFNRFVSGSLKKETIINSINKER